MQVKDIMTKEVVSVLPETKATKVARILFENNFNGLPVVDKSGIVLGLITEGDLLTKDSFGIHIPSLAKMLTDFDVLKATEGEERKNLEFIVKADARSLMNSNYVFVYPGNTLAELMKVFNERQVNPIPVVDREKKLLGIVSRSDIVKLVGKFSDAELDFLREN